MIYYKFLNPKPIYYFCEIDYVFKTERWIDVPNYIGLYKISDLGRIMGIKRNKIIKQKINTTGRLMCSICKSSIKTTVKIHKIVAISFLNHVPSKYNKIVDHINNNPLDNKLINLQIISQRENVMKYYLKNKKSKLKTGAYKNGKMFTSTISVKGKRIHLGTYKTQKEASEAYYCKLKSITYK